MSEQPGFAGAHGEEPHSHRATKAIETEEGAFFMPLPKTQDVEHE